MKNYLIVFLSLFFVIQFCNRLSAQDKIPQLLLKLDDCGLNHSVNMSIEEMAKTGIPFSTAIMFSCPWYQEAVAILKKYPHVSVGVHLDLCAEWRYYKWGPILGRSVVPSLVDSLGYFYTDNKTYLKNQFNLDEVEKELSAQIERALNSGLKIDYIDHHKQTAVATPELRALFEKLAKKYHLAMARYFGEDVFTMPSNSNKKKEVFYTHLNNLKSDKVNLVIFHTAKVDPEMNALISMNQSDQREFIAAEQRSALLNLLVSNDFKDLINQKKFQIITYRDLVKTIGLENMHRPELNKREKE